MSQLPDAGCSPATGDIRDALGKILSSENFSRSPKISRLLTHLVEKQIAGEPESLKEIAIATSVFEQQDDFNPRNNPIVRVNASRLRNLLRLYYAERGIKDTVRIMLPDVGYAPKFAQAPAWISGEQRQSEDTGPAAAQMVRETAAKTPRSSDSPERARGWRGKTNRFREVLGMPSSVAFVLANLIIACVFAVLINQTSVPSGQYLIPLPHSDQANEATDSLIMLCSRETEAAAVYPMVIGEGNGVLPPTQAAANAFACGPCLAHIPFKRVHLNDKNMLQNIESRAISVQPRRLPRPARMPPLPPEHLPLHKSPRRRPRHRRRPV